MSAPSPGPLPLDDVISKRSQLWGPARSVNSLHIFSYRKLPPKASGAERAFDHIPMHPLVERLVREWRETAPPGDRVLPSVPDNRTIERDLKKAGFAYKNAQGHLLCFHAFRHTFKHDLEKADTPYTPVRQLMRHIARSVTEAYGPSEQRAMREYLERTHQSLWKQPVETPTETYRRR